MTPASGVVENPKQFPAATMDDQDAVAARNEMEEGVEGRIVLGAVPHSSPVGHTEAQKMLPLEDGTSAYEAAIDAEQRRNAESLSGMKKDELVSLAEREDIDLPDGVDDFNDMKVDDLKDHIRQQRASGMKASDFTDKIKAAQSQEELDAVTEEYEASGKNLKSVESAIEKRQDELDAADENDDDNS
jgi:hypothetical protein